MLDPTKPGASSMVGQRIAEVGRAHASALLGRLLLLVGASLVPAVVFRPGLLNRDSLRMYRGAIGVEPVDDWNSPFLTLVLRALHAVHVGPIGYVLLQSLAFFAGIVLLCKALRLSLRATSLTVLLVLLFPPTIPWLATVEKSATMGSALVLLVGLMAWRRASGKPLLVDGGIILVSIVTMLCRANALALVLPLLFLWRLMLDHATLWRRLARATAFCGVVVAAFFATSATMSAVFKVQRTFPLQPVLVWDLAAISIARNEMLLPPFLYGGTSEMLKAQYNSSTSNHLYFPEFNGLPGLAAVRRTDHPGEIRQLRGAWARAVIANPAAYLRHRVAVFVNSLALDPRSEAIDSWHYWNGGVDPNPYGITSRAVPWLFEYYRTWRETVFFRQFPYLVALVALIAWFAWRRNGLGLSLAIGTLIYFGHHLLVAPSPSLRNYYPVVFACICCAILLADDTGKRTAVTDADRAS
jgi:hypothetical protein